MQTKRAFLYIARSICKKNGRNLAERAQIVDNRRLQSDLQRAAEILGRKLTDLSGYTIGYIFSLVGIDKKGYSQETLNTVFEA